MPSANFPIPCAGWGRSPVPKRRPSVRRARLKRVLLNLTGRYGAGKPVSVLLQIWDRPIYTVGGKHLMSDALRLCGAPNIFADLKEAAPVVDIEAVIARNPDMIIAASPPGAARAWLDDWRAFGTLKAVSTMHSSRSRISGSPDSARARLMQRPRCVS